eukprot:gene2924-3377_t
MTSPSKRRFVPTAASPTSPKKRLSDYCGYVTHVNDFQRSSSGNEYFDISMKTSPNTVMKVRVMVKTAEREEKQKLFHEKLNVPVLLKDLSEGYSGFAFFNQRSTIEDGAEHVSFKCDEEKLIDLGSLEDKIILGTFCVRGLLKWIGDEKVVNVNKPSNAPTTKTVREAVIKDETGQISISLWEELTKLPDGSIK